MRLLTVGVGSLPGEATAMGVDFATRGRRADETIDALRVLWSGDAQGVGFDGTFVNFTDVCSFPKPHESTTLPIHVGGSSQAAAKRAGTRGDGYFPGGVISPGERAAQIDTMRMAARQAGRDPDLLEYTRWGSLDMDAADVEKRAAQGVTRIVVNPGAADLDEQLAELSAFARRVRLTSADAQDA